MEPQYYNVNLHWDKDREGLICSPEIQVYNEDSCIRIATPPEFKKGIPGIWSPEHLFTAAINSCFMTTFLAIAENFKLDFVSFNCSSKGKLESVDGKMMISEVVLIPDLKIPEANDLSLALKVLAKAESSCLISNSVKTRVTMDPIVTFSAWEKEKIHHNAGNQPQGN